MNINEVENTCSLAEIGDVSLSSLENRTRESLITEVLDERPDTKAIIFNCIDDDIIALAKSKYHFEEVFTYRGNSGSDVVVLMLDINE